MKWWIFSHLFQLLTQPAESQEEITARHHIADQLERRFIPRSLCKSSLFAEFNNELKILKEAVHSGSGEEAFTEFSSQSCLLSLLKQMK